MEVSGLPRATYYYHLKHGESPDKYKKLKEQISEICQENHGRYGYRRVTICLRALDVCVNHKTVQRQMKELGLVCKVRMKKYRSYKGSEGETAANLLERDFKADVPNRKWVTDVTEFRLHGEKLYLSPILDLCSQDVVSYALSERPTLAMVEGMMDSALKRVPEVSGVILHSDQGWQYRHKQYHRLLEENGILQSMSRKGNCYDNAVIENFFGHVKSELLYMEEFDSMAQFRTSLEEYLDYYNNRRIKCSLGGLPPAIHRAQTLEAG